ncbi:xanthine dehydrogenase family protein molybdopterin-binding subunit [Chloroflexota bacterium]
MSEEFRYIGKRVPRTESVPKVTGSMKYLDDMTLPGTLYAKFLRSPHPHARVVKIDKSQAESLPGVELILTPADIIGKVGKLGTVPPKNQNVLEEEPRYVGDEIAAVCAVDEATAERALELIKVTYEKLPAVFDPEEAMSPGAPQLHEEAGNIRARRRVRVGDIETGFREADYIFKSRFRTSKQSHVMLEPHGCLSSYDRFSGRLTHWTIGQVIEFTRLGLCETLHLPTNKVRVISPEAVGGSFGGKGQVATHDACTALMSLALGKPVKLVLSREEMFMGTASRHPIIRDSEIGLKQDGTITAWRENIIMDSGAYGRLGEWIALITQGLAPGPYKIPHIWIDTAIVYTNKPVSASFRGFGNPQATFARESILDMAAREMGLDPIELRLKNTIKTEDLPFTTSTGSIVRSCGIDECITKVTGAIGWEKPRKAYSGVGMACMAHCTSMKLGADYAAAEISVAPDGSAIVRTGATDLGQGLLTTLGQIAAEELGLPLEGFTVLPADTDISPPDVGVHGSRSAFTTGAAVKYAAVEAKQKLIGVAARMLEVPPESLVARPGEIYNKDDPSQALTIKEALRAAYFAVGEPITGHGLWVTKAGFFDADGYGNFTPAYPFGAEAARVEVDPETGQVRVTGYAAAHDVGRALNPDIVEGQIQGGVAQGIGYALSEGLFYDETGEPLNTMLRDYKVPAADELPDIQAIIVESIEPDGPFGNKGVGEVSLNCAAAAIVNAIANAIGVRITELPITPAKILRALKTKQSRQQ